MSSAQRAIIPPDLPLFGRRLRRLRRARGVKQSALADLLDLDQATISRWERGTHVPSAALRQAALGALGPMPSGDAALRRLVDRSADCVHLVDEATHVRLGYSAGRARDWGGSARAMLGVSLWRFATEEIRRAEAELDEAGWWDLADPRPKVFMVREAVQGEITISAGTIVWERLYLCDGTPVRLVTGQAGSPGA